LSSKKVHTPPEAQESLITNAKHPKSDDHGPPKHKKHNKKITKETGKLYQDQIYGPKVLTPLAVEIIDTPEFQRLEGIKQLGFANVTYRGAEHTRLSHSIGTYFITKTIMRRIVQNHERFGYDHPGKDLPDSFSLFPNNVKASTPTCQSRWRGITEIVSLAALLHDITHVPFGHTLEDEFENIYDRHDTLAGPRLYKLLFHDDSHLSKLLSNTKKIRLEISNKELKQLLYVILSWKEQVDTKKLTGFGFDKMISDEEDKRKNELEKKEVALMECKIEEEKRLIELHKYQINQYLDRLKLLRNWHNCFVNKERNMFHPFMSDVIANTICADLLDYLPRDRMNLGMEYSQHDRIQRFLTIRAGTLYDNEGLRLSILVTRRQKGGQRRDVATAVLRIMRERYEMAELVYYHHKKAAVSSMLATLVEICPKPNDDESVYPAPWTSDTGESHILHFTDSSLIDYLGKAPLAGC
jgi:HD superfamily phosphohydrolase